MTPTSFYKCPGFYCIPWQYVCNNRIDCPGGLEEKDCNKQSCLLPGQFKCRESAICVSLESVCDDIIDCPFRDDEYFCNMFPEDCPVDCNCQLFNIKCTNWNLKRNHNLKNGVRFPYTTVSITNASLTNISSFLQDFDQVLEFKLSANQIFDICLKWSQYKGHSVLTNLSVTLNNLTLISSKCFSNLPLLRYVNISYNLIAELKPFSFHNAVNLFILDLSYNEITHLIHSVFFGGATLKVLNLKGNFIDHVSADFFVGLEVWRIHAESYKLCCIKPNPNTTCDAVPDWPNSCGNLIYDRASKIMIWCVGILGMIMNCAVFCLMHQTKKDDTNYKSMVWNIAVGDLLCSLYLLSLSIADLVFHGRYIENDPRWRGSWICFISCILSIATNLLSVFFMHLLVVSRYCIVKFPLDSRYLQKSIILWHRALGFTVIVALSVCLVGIYRHLSKDNLMPTGLCLLVGYIDTSLIPTLVTWLGIFSQGIPIITIPVINIFLIIEKQKSDKRVMMAFGKKRTSHGMVKRLALASLSNLLCWIASTILLLLTVSWPKYPYPVLVWTIIIALPLNTLINPFILVLSKEIRKPFTVKG